MKLREAASGTTVQTPGSPVGRRVGPLVPKKHESDASGTAVKLANTFRQTVHISWPYIPCATWRLHVFRVASEAGASEWEGAVCFCDGFSLHCSTHAAGWTPALSSFLSIITLGRTQQIIALYY